MLARYDINCSCMVIFIFVLAFEMCMLFMKGYVTIIAVDYVTIINECSNHFPLKYRCSSHALLLWWYRSLSILSFKFYASKETNYAIVTVVADRLALVCSYAGGLRIDPMALAKVLSGGSRRVSVVSTETPF